MWNFGGVYQEKTLTFARKLCHKNSHGTLSNPDLSKKGKILCTNSILMILFGQLTSFHFWLRNKETSFNKKNPPPKARMLGSGWLVGFWKASLTLKGKKIRSWNHLSEVLLHFNQCLGSLYLGSCHFDVTGVVVVVTSCMNWRINERGRT